jgi:transposase
VLFHTKEPGPWLEQLRKRRPMNVAVVAQANKMARTIWAILAHDRQYDKDHVSVKPA